MNQKRVEKTLQQVEKQLEDFKSDLREITSGNPKHKCESQLYTIKNVKIFMAQDKKLLIYSMIIQELDLKLFKNQNKMKLKEQGLKY